MATLCPHESDLHFQPPIHSTDFQYHFMNKPRSKALDFHSLCLFVVTPLVRSPLTLRPPSVSPGTGTALQEAQFLMGIDRR